MDSWFTSSGNEVSSAHFGVSKDGRIHQYVKIERMAWTNGIKADGFKFATAPMVKELKVNPNLYTVSIEHEGTDGDLTEAQYLASLWLHFYIRDYVKKVYGSDIKLDKTRVVGHYQIDPRRKPNCPGPRFPWERLYADLAKGSFHAATKKDEPAKPATPKPAEPAKPATQTIGVLDADDANAIIKLIQSKWSRTDDANEKKELHRLANELRRLSGQLK
jgi:N-acetyl-anhydromuramyl-L-alanine amidase AmpD